MLRILEILEMKTLHTCRAAGFDLESQIESEDPLNPQFSKIKYAAMQVCKLYKMNE